MRRLGAFGYTRRRAMLALGAIGGSTVIFGTPAHAAYPERPIKIVAPFPPGASNDLTARIVGAALAGAFGVPVVIENRPGANGAIGSAAVACAAPDGYTLLLVPNVFEVNPLLSKQAAYDPVKDFAPIADIASIPNVIAANPATGLKTFADLIARSRAQPDALNFSTPGVGSISHLGAELLKRRANLRLTHVPYAGAAPALQAVLAGTVQLVGITIATALPHIKAGNLVADRCGALARPAGCAYAGRGRHPECGFRNLPVALCARRHTARERRPAGAGDPCQLVSRRCAREAQGAKSGRARRPPAGGAPAHRRGGRALGRGDREIRNQARVTCWVTSNQ